MDGTTIMDGMDANTTIIMTMMMTINVAAAGARHFPKLTTFNAAAGASQIAKLQRASAF
jgi:hypothetical protein